MHKKNIRCSLGLMPNCTHYTSHSLLNLVHDIVCEFGLAIQDYIFLDFNAKCVWCLTFEDKLVEKLIFGRSGLNLSVYEKTFNLILMHFIYEILCFEEFLHKFAMFFKNLIFPYCQSIESVAQPIEIVIKILVWICLARLVLNWSNLIFD